MNSEKKVVFNREVIIKSPNDNDSIIEQACDTVYENILEQNENIDTIFEVSIKEKNYIKLQKLDIENTEKWNTIKQFNDYESATKYLIDNINNITTYDDPLSVNTCKFRIIEK